MSNFSISERYGPTSHLPGPFSPSADGAPPALTVDVPSPAAPQTAEIQPPLPPSLAGGRDSVSGRFTTNNVFGRHGNSVARKAARLRRAMYRETTEADLRAIVRRLITDAVAGDVASSKVVIGQLLGPGANLDLIETVSKIEGLVFRTRGEL